MLRRLEEPQVIKSQGYTYEDERRVVHVHVNDIYWACFVCERGHSTQIYSSVPCQVDGCLFNGKYKDRIEFFV